MNRIGMSSALGLALAVTAGCAAPGPLGGPIASNWVLDRQAVGPAAAIAPVLAPGAAAPARVGGPQADAPEAPADPAFVAIAESLALPLPAAEPVRRSGGSGSSRAAAATSRLTVDLRGFLGALAPARARRLLATVDDVAKVVVTVYQPGQPEKVITVTKAQISAGVAEVTFPELALGNAIVFAVAYDAADIPIGSAAQVAVVNAGGAAMADLPMQLVPTGGSGGGPGGTLIARTTLLDGPVPDPASGTVLTEIRDAGGHLIELEPAADGGMYATTMLLVPGTAAHQQANGRTPGLLLRYAADGTRELQAQIAGGRVMARVRHAADGLWLMASGRHIPAAALAAAPAQVNLLSIGQALPYNAVAAAVGADGQLLYMAVDEPGRPIYRISPAGVETATPMTGASCLALDPAGNLWANVATDPMATLGAVKAAETVRKYAPDGSVLGTFPVPGPVAYVWAAPDGTAWVGHAGAGASITGSILNWQISAAPHLSHLAADGTVLATLNLPTRDLAFDHGGNVWVAAQGALKKLAPDGTELGSWASFSTSVAVATDGKVWTNGPYGLFRRIQP